MHIWTDDEEFVIASDELDARAVFAELGCVVPEDVRLIPYQNDRPFTMTQEDGSKVTKLCIEWVREKGRGYLGCCP